MSNIHVTALRLPYSPTRVALGIVGMLVVVYLGMIATVMSYAALTVEFSQSVRSSEAAVATLESKYLAHVAEITSTNYSSLGYAKPSTQTFVPTQSGTARR